MKHGSGVQKWLGWVFLAGRSASLMRRQVRSGAVVIWRLNGGRRMHFQNSLLTAGRLVLTGGGRPQFLSTWASPWAAEYAASVVADFPQSSHQKWGRRCNILSDLVSGIINFYLGHSTSVTQTNPHSACGMNMRRRWSLRAILEAGHLNKELKITERAEKLCLPVASLAGGRDLRDRRMVVA